MLKHILLILLTIVSISAKTPEITDYLKDAKKIAGFLNLYQKDEDYFLVVTEKDFKSDFLMTASVAHGVGSGGVFGGTMLKTKVVKFRKIRDQIQFLFRNVLHTAPGDKQLQRAVDVNFQDQIAGSFKILAESKNKYCISADALFASDLYNLTLRLKYVYGSALIFNPKLSYINKVKNFKGNTEIRSALTFMQRSSTGNHRNYEILLHHSFFPFPKNKYKPREADLRVGFFHTELKDYSLNNDEMDVFVRYIKRWDLEKAEPRAEKSLPKKPIVYYLAKNIPLKYRKYVRAGVLEWNKAFEKIGFIGAVEARIQSDEENWDPENNDYHTISWITTDKASYGAIGPSRANPLTGEILDADILFDESRLRRAMYDFQKNFGTSHLEDQPDDSHQDEDGKHDEFTEDESEHCNVYELVGSQLGLILLTNARNLKVKPTEATSEEEPEAKEDNNKDDDEEKNEPEKKDDSKSKELAQLKEEFIGQAIKWVIMHEVGHTLGLRHNFKGSTLHSADKLQDRELAEKEGLYNSVMDYPGVNISENPEKQGYFYTPTLGAYDYWAISYGYSVYSKKAEKKQLNQLASMAGKHELAYSTDEDARKYAGADVDPYSNLYDLGEDPMEYATSLIRIIGDSWSELLDRMVAENQSYDLAERAYYSLINQYARSLDMIAKFIGGKEYLRIHRGNVKKNPLEPISFAKQRLALQKLKEYAFNEKFLTLPQNLVESIPASRWSNWGTNNVWGSPLDKNVYRTITWVMAKPIDKLFQPRVLGRILDQQNTYANDKDVLTIEEVFDSIATGVFSEIYKDAKGEYPSENPFISVTKRNLHRVLINSLMQLVNAKRSGSVTYPYEAKTMARYTLKRILYRIDHFQKESRYDRLDSMSKIHLDDVYNRIKHFLEADYVSTNF
jgi:hypothetical protein